MHINRKKRPARGTFFEESKRNVEGNKYNFEGSKRNFDECKCNFGGNKRNFDKRKCNFERSKRNVDKNKCNFGVNKYNFAKSKRNVEGNKYNLVGSKYNFEDNKKQNTNFKEKSNMNKQEFERIEQQYLLWIKGMEAIGCKLHHQTNQEYDENLPYGFHLKLAASFVSKYGYLVAENEADVLTLYAAAYLHDSIEDARVSYNDVAKLIKNFSIEGIVLNTESQSVIETLAPEIVYALTNEKGKNRKERANENYYKGIRETRFAPFVKMCDRMANIRYGTLFASESRMFEIYRTEHDVFIKSISVGAVTPVPREMEQELISMLGAEQKV